MPDLSQLTHGTSGQLRSFPCSEPVRALEFCQTGDDRVLVAAGGDSRVTIGQFHVMNFEYGLLCQKEVAEIRLSRFSGES